MIARMQLLALVSLVGYPWQLGGPGRCPRAGSGLAEWVFCGDVCAGPGPALCADACRPTRRCGARPRWRRCCGQCRGRGALGAGGFGWRCYRAAPACPTGCPMPPPAIVAWCWCTAFVQLGLWLSWMRCCGRADMPYVAVNLEPVFGSIDAYAATVDDAVLPRRGTGPPPVLGAQHGWLATRAWLRAFSADARVHRVITFGHAARRHLVAAGWPTTGARCNRPARGCSNYSLTNLTRARLFTWLVFQLRQHRFPGTHGGAARRAPTVAAWRCGNGL